ncbi:MFS transporter [Bacillus cereus]
MNEVNHEIYKPVKANRLWMILVLGTLTAIGPLSIDMYLPSLPKLTDDLQTGASLAQLTLTACLLGLSVGQLFVGSISDIYGRRKPLIIALIIYVASSLLCAVAPSIWTLVLLRFLQGASGSAGIVISRAMVRDMYSGSGNDEVFLTACVSKRSSTYFGTDYWGAIITVYNVARCFHRSWSN